MTKSFRLLVLVGLTVALAGCGWMPNGAGGSGSQPEFVAGNGSSVLVDVRNSGDADVTAARQVAVDKCTLFGKRNAVLESINPISDGKDRISFACQ